MRVTLDLGIKRRKINKGRNMVFYETLYREVVHKGLEACEGPVESESSQELL